jgi:carbonic anhydrase/acetyltransferase-like protein (isoleucine patch superfamily)
MIVLGRPSVGKGSFIDPKASVLGNVIIGDGVYIAPFASIRADEPGSRIIIGDRANVQDGVVIHALRGSTVMIGRGTTLGHACIVHGPCEIGERCFVGFGAVVFRGMLGDHSAVLHRSVVTNASIPSGRMVRTGAVITSNEGVNDLPPICPETFGLMESAHEVNYQLAIAYSRRDSEQCSPDPNDPEDGQMLP